MSPDALPAGPAEDATGLFNPHWRLNPVIDLHWRDWDAESVVIETRSGDTLLFDPLSAGAMAAIEAGCTDIQDLTRQMAEDLAMAPDAALDDALHEVLERLFRLGWIEPVDGPCGPGLPAPSAP